MSSNLPDKNEPFAQLIKSMNMFFQEKPVKGFLQSIDDFFRTPFPFMSFPLNVVEKDQEHIITAELPGIHKDQIHIDVMGNYLTVNVRNNEVVTEEDEAKHIFRKRQSMQQTSRTISLPHPINEQRVKASYQNGLLTIRVPKQKGKTIIIHHE